MAVQKYIISGSDTPQTVANRLGLRVPDLYKKYPELSQSGFGINAGKILTYEGNAPTESKPKDSIVNEPKAPASAGISVRDVLSSGSSPREALVGRILGSLDRPSLVERRRSLEEEKGVSGLSQNVDAYNTEITKTVDLLNNLEKDLSSRTGEFVFSEPQRRRTLAAEKTPVSDLLKTLQSGEKSASSRLNLAKKDITEELGLEEKQQSGDINLLKELDTATKSEKLSTAVRNIGGRQILINTQTGERIRDLGPVSASPKAGNTLTLNEATNYGLPLEMVGMDETRVASDLKSKTPPPWFKTKIESEKRQSLTPGALASLWETFRGGYVDSSGNLKKKSGTSSSSSIQNPFAN